MPQKDSPGGFASRFVRTYSTYFLRTYLQRTYLGPFENPDVTWRMTYENTGALRLGTFPFLQDELDSLLRSHCPLRRNSVFYIGTLLRSQSIRNRSSAALAVSKQARQPHARTHTTSTHTRTHTRIQRIRSSSSSSSLLRTTSSDAFGTAQLLGVTSQHEQ